MAKCPVCFNNLDGYGSSGYSGFTDDPILTPNHKTPAYRGTTQARGLHILELRERINDLETIYGLLKTIWTPLTPQESMPRVQYINELRTALETILTAVGLTLTDYLSTDAEGNPTLGISGWSTRNRLSESDLIRAIHIEELRKVLIAIGFDTINGTSNGNLFYDGVLGNKSIVDETPWFHRGIYTQDDICYFFDNMAGCSFYQSETGILYRLSNWDQSSYWGTPVISWYPTLINLDYTELLGYHGYSTGGTELQKFQEYGLAFDPVLPYDDLVTANYPQLGYEGIDSVAIDDYGDDYTLYTTEFFYERAGLTSGYSGYSGWNVLNSGVGNYVAKYTYPKTREVAVGTGLPTQIYSSTLAGIYAPIPIGSEVLTVGGEVWTRVENFAGSGANDKHYLLNYNTGFLFFGNGSLGYPPQLGDAIRLFITLGGSVSGYSGYSGVSAHIGGVWKFDKIVAPRTVNGFYAGLQAKGGKVWWNYKANAFEQLVNHLSDVTCNFGNIGYNENWFSGYSGYSKNPPPTLIEITQNSNRGNSSLGQDGTCTVSGGVTVTGNPYYSGMLDGGFHAGTPWTDAFGITHNPPRCISNTFGSWSFIYEPYPNYTDKDDLKPQGNMITNNFVYNYQNYNPLVTFAIRVSYGTFHYIGPDIGFEWVEHLESSVYIRPAQEGNFAFADVLGFLDFPYGGTVADPCIDHMTAIYSGSSIVGYYADEIIDGEPIRFTLNSNGILRTSDDGYKLPSSYNVIMKGGGFAPPSSKLFGGSELPYEDFTYILSGGVGFPTPPPPPPWPVP